LTLGLCSARYVDLKSALTTPLGPAKLGRSRTRIVGPLAERRTDRLLTDALVDSGSLPVLERRLDEPVFTAVEADDRSPPAGPQAPRQHPQQFLQVRQLPVHQDPKGLEDSRRRPDALLPRRWLAFHRVWVDVNRGRFHDQVHQFTGTLHGLHRPAA